MPSDEESPKKSEDEVKLSLMGIREGRYRCPYCKQGYDSQRALGLHCKYIHNGGAENGCYELIPESKAKPPPPLSKI